MVAKSQDKVLFGFALLVLLAAAGWVALQQSKLASLRQIPAPRGANSVYVPAGIDAPQVSTKTWPSPPPQTRGPEWIYDVFTPPEIYYNAATQEFSVTPPISPKTEASKEPPFGLELVQVKQDVFRLQLVGYVGTAGDYRGTFENTVTGDTFLARAGKKLPALGLTIRSFDVKRNRIESKESMPIYDTVATAVVVDDKTGDEVVLTNKIRRIKGSPIAILKATDVEKPFEQKAGTSFTVGTVEYTVKSVQADPPSAEIVKSSPDLKEPLAKTLIPQAAATPAVEPVKGDKSAKTEAVSTFPAPAFP
ncbi:MAG: hypothetical protein JF599_12790 [Verrucomicrobia bacterium]|nr:hypothetical protein [Verrucomicrobiota bacterium]